MCDASFAGNIEWFSGFSELYSQHRPNPPAFLANLIARYCDANPWSLIVDLGSGTGSSTRYWAGHARQVIGVEPSDDMRRQAEKLTTEKNITYRSGLAHSTGLPNACAQVVVCFQSLHWMDPQPTFEEITRILVPGGVFATADYDWPPATGSWPLEESWHSSMAEVRKKAKELKIKEPLLEWDQKGHLLRMQTSGCFRNTKEILLHHVDEGDADRFVGALLSQGVVMALVKKGLTMSQLKIDAVRDTAEQILGKKGKSWHWSCRLRLGRR